MGDGAKIRRIMNQAVFIAVISLIEFLISHLSEEEQIVRDIKMAFELHHAREDRDGSR